MLATIRARLGAVFLGFMLLVAGSVVATFIAVRAQTDDATVINLAGRQRMLTQKMTKAVLGIARDPLSGYGAELDESLHLFDTTLTALLDGGPAPYGDETVTLPPTTDPAIRAQMEVVVGLWNRFRQEVETVQATEPEGLAFERAVREIEALSPVILQEMDRAVRLWEAAARLKLDRVRATQVFFFICALGLLVAGHILTLRSVVKPITALQEATQRIADGDLESPIGASSAASSGIRALARSFEDMRQKLDASRLESERWAAELESRVDQRTRQLAGLFEVSSEIASQLGIRQVMDSVVEHTRQLAGADIAVLCLLDPSTESFRLAALSGSDEALTGVPPTSLRSFSAGALPSSGAVLLHDGCDCPLLEPHFRRSHVAVPLYIADRTLGMLCVGHRDNDRFGEEQVRLLALLANTSAVALENARLYGQAEQSAALMERERIVAEIHDGLAQTLGFLGLRLGVVAGSIGDQEIAELPAHLAMMQRTVDQASREVRRLMAGLQTGTQGQGTLEELLEQTVDRFAEEREMDIDLQVDTGQPTQGPRDIHEQVLRVVVEALTNIHKHASASHAKVTLERQEGRLAVSVQDDGPGFDVGVAANQRDRFGLKVMQARARRIGGELSLTSAPGHRTTVTLRWPTTGTLRGVDHGTTNQGSNCR